MKRIVLIVDFFGTRPPWFDLYVHTCRFNPTIDWIINTDCLYISDPPANVKVNQMSLAYYLRKVKSRLGVTFSIVTPYKLCDLRPTYGVLHADLIDNYDLFGYTDIDILYGRLREFYDDDVLSYNTISNHKWTLSGHLALIRNTAPFRNAFRRIPLWERRLELATPQRLDEDAFGELFRYPSGLPYSRRAGFDAQFGETAIYRRRNYWVEQYTTPLTPGLWHDGSDHHPEEWFWQNGRVTNSRFPERSYPYLHFMNFKAPRFLHKRYERTAPWSKVGDMLPPSVCDSNQMVIVGINGIAVQKLAR